MCTTVAALAYATTSFVMVPDLEIRPPEPTTVRTDPVEALKTKHECWTGSQTAPDVPSKAIVARPGQAPRVVPADVGFGVRSGDIEGDLYAFCL